LRHIHVEALEDGRLLAEAEVNAFEFQQHLVSRVFAASSRRR
jgi:hypothetical protein